MDTTLKRQCTRPVVAAIEIGTTHSGWAFSFIHEWDRVHFPSCHQGIHLSCKNSSCLLLKKHSYEFVNFGYEAEEQYNCFLENEENANYLYFKDLQTVFHRDMNGNRKILCEDILGEKVEANIVLMHCIRYFKAIIAEYFIARGIDGHPSDIAYVLSGPVRMGNRAILREAAIKAGIERDQLTLVTKADAASTFLQNVISENSEEQANWIRYMRPGTKYIVLILGGMSVNLSVYQKYENHSSKEVLATRWGPFGSKAVDDNYINFVTDVVGEKTMKNFKEKYLEEFLDMMREIEIKKKFQIEVKKSKDDSYAFIRLSREFIEFCVEQHNVEKFNVLFEKSVHKEDVMFIRDKLRLRTGRFIGFFQNILVSIIKHIENNVDEEMMRDINIMFLVGGFANCSLVQEAIRNKFSSKKVIVPKEADIAVLKGSVYFGHLLDSKLHWSVRYTYGIETFLERYIGSETSIINKYGRCRPSFSTFVRRGQQIVSGDRMYQSVRAIVTGKTELECALYVSDQMNPKYVDESGSKMLGILKIPIPIDSPEEIDIELTLIFGKAELILKSEICSSEATEEAIFDYLD